MVESWKVSMQRLVIDSSWSVAIKRPRDTDGTVLYKYESACPSRSRKVEFGHSAVPLNSHLLHHVVMR